MEAAHPAADLIFQLRSRRAALLHDHRSGAPWHDTPGATWQLVAAMLRNQRRELEERPHRQPSNA